MPCGGQFAHQACTAALVPTSMPRVGSSRIRMRGLVESHFASTTFCWLPPESSRTFCQTCRGSHFHLPWPPHKPPAALLSCRQPASLGILGQDRQGDVLGDIHRRDQPVMLAVFGHIGQPVLHRLLGLVMCTACPSISILPLVAGSTPKMAWPHRCARRPPARPSPGSRPCAARRRYPRRDPCAVRFSTCSTTSPACTSCLGEQVVTVRPTIMRIRSSLRHTFHACGCPRRRHRAAR